MVTPTASCSGSEGSLPKDKRIEESTTPMFLGIPLDVKINK
jgi:hypothetical protein